MSNLSMFERIGSLIPPIQYSALTLDDLEHPRLVAIYSIYWEVSLVVTTVFFTFMLYMIITKSSREMSGYKWYLVHQLTWSYVFDVYLGLWKPVPLWPFYIAYSTGVFSNISDEFIPIQLLFLIINAIGMGFAVYISAMHRYMQASPFSLMYDIYSNPFYRTAIYISGLVLVLSVLCIPTLYFLPNQTFLKAALADRYPVMKELVKRHPSMIGYDPLLDNNACTTFVMILILVLLLVALSIFLLHFNFLRILRKNKQRSSTYEMQYMLYRALIIQVLLAGVLLILPITTCLVLLLFGVKWTSTFSLFAIAVIGIHPIADFLVLIYFVKSYREYVKKLLNNLSRVS